VPPQGDEVVKRRQTFYNEDVGVRYTDIATTIHPYRKDEVRRMKDEERQQTDPPSSSSFLLPPSSFSSAG
jgi:hypothetical protein